MIITAIFGGEEEGSGVWVRRSRLSREKISPLLDMIGGSGGVRTRETAGLPRREDLEPASLVGCEPPWGGMDLGYLAE